jgi:hypothetical protein
MALTLRNIKGSPLTHAELDNNFQYMAVHIDSAISASLTPISRVLSAPNPVQIDKEIPCGVINGINTTFILNYEPILNSEHVYLNGILQESGEDSDYVLEGKNIVFSLPVRTNSRLRCSYRFI